MSAVAGTAHQAFMIASTVIWGFYRSFYFDRAAKVSCHASQYSRCQCRLRVRQAA